MILTALFSFVPIATDQEQYKNAEKESVHPSRQVKSARPGPYLPRLLTLELPLVTKTEFLLTISIQYPTDK